MNDLNEDNEFNKLFDNTLNELNNDKYYKITIDLLLVQKKSDAEIMKELINIGLERNDAIEIINEVHAEINRLKKRTALKDIFWGLLWLFGGLIITFISYNTASDSGSYFVTYGAIIYGGIRSLVGIYKYF